MSRSLGRAIAALALGSAAVAVPGAATACEGRDEPLTRGESTPTPFDRLACNLLDAAGGENLLLYGAAILSTVELSATYADHDTRVAIETYAQSRPFGHAMVALGYVGVPAVGALLYGAGLARRDRVLGGGGAAVIQAMSVTFVTTVLLKVATGRPFPDHGGDPYSPDRLEHPEWSREWNGPRLENSAWPSGHMSVSMSFASALTAYYATDAPWVGLVTYPVAGAIGFGVLSGADHWLSDVVAGALLGQAVGWSIGRDFRRMRDAQGAPRGAGAAVPSLQLRIVPFSGARGLGVVGAF